MAKRAQRPHKRRVHTVRPPAPAGFRLPMISADTIPVAWEGGFFETHSLALVNRELALALLGTGRLDLGIRLRQLEPLKFDPRADPRLEPLLRAVNRSFSQHPAVYIRHAWPPVFERPAAAKWVMIQPWEFGPLPQDWVAPMRDLVDEVWIPSHAVRQMYVDSGVPEAKVFVVPNGVDTTRFRPQAQPFELPTAKRTRFLFVGGTIWRKGIDVLLNAYCKAFRRGDDVSLVVKDMGQDSFYKGQGAGETIARLQADPAAPEILYATGSLTDQDMAGLYTACTCLVHPYRGEGFGLPVAEAMACGLPVIVTQGGATDDFCQGSWAYHCPASRREFTMQQPTAGTPWVLEPDVDALAALLRQVHDEPATAAARGHTGSDWARAHLTWEHAAEVAMDRLAALSSSAPPDLVPATDSTRS